MVDEKIENDQVWITVVATGYDDRPRSRRMVEPAGEPRVSRVSERVGAASERSSRASADQMDVPEFHPAWLSCSERDLGPVGELSAVLTASGQPL